MNFIFIAAKRASVGCPDFLEAQVYQGGDQSRFFGSDSEF